MEHITIRAKVFARTAHAQQVRKYTGEPYFNHLEEVANILYTHGFRDEVIAAAYLHDVIEDTPVSREMVEEYFGPAVAQLVWEVTDRSKPSDGVRKVRKEIDRMWLSKASPAAQSIKLADLISNNKDIVAGDKNFARVYLREKAALLEVLTSGCTWLYTKAKFELIRGEEALIQAALEG
jgi:(p)ppGpp synthase/HD superfamily hydrolase